MKGFRVATIAYAAITLGCALYGGFHGFRMMDGNLNGPDGAAFGAFCGAVIGIPVFVAMVFAMAYAFRDKNGSQPPENR